MIEAVVVMIASAAAGAAAVLVFLAWRGLRHERQQEAEPWVTFEHEPLPDIDAEWQAFNEGRF